MWPFNKQRYQDDGFTSDDNSSSAAILSADPVIEIRQPVTAILQAMELRPDSFYFYSRNVYTPYESSMMVVDSITRASFYLYTSYGGYHGVQNSSCAGWISNEEASALVLKCRAMMEADKECRDNLERTAICALYNVTPPQTPDNQPTS